VIFLSKLFVVKGVEMRKFQFWADLSDTEYNEINALRATLGLKTTTDLLNAALTLMKWAVTQRQTGRVITSVDDANKTYVELSMSCLDQVSKKP
jgi:hypothetical protein